MDQDMIDILISRDLYEIVNLIVRNVKDRDQCVAVVCVLKELCDLTDEDCDWITIEAGYGLDGQIAGTDDIGDL
jgi:hypothetical protein